jgi:hypothetical protein
MPQEDTEQEDRPSRQQRNSAPVDTTASDLAGLQTVKRLLDVLKEGGMGVTGFLDTLFVQFDQTPICFTDVLLICFSLPHDRVLYFLLV